MNNDTLTIRQGETFYEPIKYFDTAAESAVITVSDDDGNVVLTTGTSFTVEDDWAVGEFKSNDTDIPVGEYHWMITITTPDAGIKLPKISDCEDGCELPLFIVCEANDIGAES